MRTVSDEFLRQQLRQLGYSEPEPLAIGMQAAVFRLGAAKVAKIWFHAGEDVLRRLSELLTVLDGQLPYRTPRILELHRPGPYCVTIEPELPGVPLQSVVPTFGSPGWERGRDCVIEVLEAVAQVEAPPVLHQLTVLDEVDSFRPDDLSWTDALGGLVRRRVERFGDQLRPVVDSFDRKFANLLTRLSELKEPRNRLVHGDVTAANILVDDSLRPVTLLDLGMLTMPGDPVFDAAAAGSLYDIWSPSAREVEAAFDTAVISRLGYDAEQLLLYRCIHSLLIGNAHDADPYGRDSGVPLTARLFNGVRVTAFLGG